MTLEVQELTIPSPRGIRNIGQFQENVFGLLCRQGALYRKPDEGDALYLCLGYGEPIFVGQNDFGGVLHQLIRFRTSKDGQAPEDCVLDHQYYPILYHCFLKRSLPEILQVVKEPTIYFDPNGVPHITEKGYDPISKIYFSGTFVCKEREGVEHLKKCFSGVPFPGGFGSGPFLSNIISALLGAIVLDKKMNNPLLTVTGNQAGIGKTSVVAAICFILTGYDLATISADPSEMQKEAGGHFRQGRRILTVDNLNVKKSDETYRNDWISMQLTNPNWSKSVRELGFSRQIEQKGVMFCITANHAKLHEDLAVRSLMIRLYREKLEPMEPYVLEYAHEHRAELYGELLGLARSLATFKISKDYAPWFRFRHWLDFVVPRVEPHFGPLELSSGIELNPHFVDLCTFAILTESYRRGERFTSAELLSDVVHIESLDNFRNNLEGNTPRGRARHLTVFLSNYCGRPVTVEGHQITLEEAEPSSSGTHRFRFKIIELEEAIRRL